MPMSFADAAEPQPGPNTDSSYVFFSGVLGYIFSRFNAHIIAAGASGAVDSHPEFLAATSAATANTLVKRDGNGGFAFGPISIVVPGTGTVPGMAIQRTSSPNSSTVNDFTVTNGSGQTVFGVGYNARGGTTGNGVYASEPAFFAGGATIGFGSSGLFVNAGLQLNTNAFLAMGTGAFSNAAGLVLDGTSGNAYFPQVVTIAGAGNSLNAPGATSVTFPKAKLTVARGGVDPAAIALFAITDNGASSLLINVAATDYLTTTGLVAHFAAQSILLPAPSTPSWYGILVSDLAQTLSLTNAASSINVAIPTGQKLLAVFRMPTFATGVLAQTTDPTGTVGYIAWDGGRLGGGGGSGGSGGVTTPGNVRYATGGASYADTIRTFVSGNVTNAMVAGTNSTPGQLMVNGSTSNGPVVVIINGIGVTFTGSQVSNNSISVANGNSTGVYSWIWSVANGVFSHYINYGVITLQPYETIVATFMWDGLAGIQWNTVNWAPVTGQFGSSAYKPITRKSTQTEYAAYFSMSGANAANLSGNYGTFGVAPIAVYLPTAMRYEAKWRAQVTQGATACQIALAFGVNTGGQTTTPTSKATLFYDLPVNASRSLSDFYVSEDTEYLAAGLNTFYLLGNVNNAGATATIAGALLTLHFHA